MSARPLPTRDAGQPSPARRRLAADVRAALEQLRRSQRAAADATKGRTDDVALLITLDDLAAITADLALVDRDLHGHAR